MENSSGRDCVNNISKQLKFEHSTRIAFQSSHQQQRQGRPHRGCPGYPESHCLAVTTKYSMCLVGVDTPCLKPVAPAV